LRTLANTAAPAPGHRNSPVCLHADVNRCRHRTVWRPKRRAILFSSGHALGNVRRRKRIHGTAAYSVFVTGRWSRGEKQHCCASCDQLGRMALSRREATRSFMVSCRR